jgi:hypothetical protein
MPKSDRRTRVGIVAAVTGMLLAAAAIATPPAIGKRGSDPVAVAAHFPQTAPVMVPGPGDATVTSSTLPASATQATVDLVPGPSQTAKDFDELTAAVVGNFPKLKRLNQKSRRILTCVFMTAGTLNNDFGFDQFRLSNPVYQVLALSECLQLVLALPAPAADVAGSAAATCKRLSETIPVQVTHTSSGFTGQVNATPRPAHGRSPVTVSCRRNGVAFRLTIRPSKHGRRLTQALGSTLGIGFVNRTTSPVDLRATIAVH